MASTKRFCICTDDRDADDLFAFGLDWVARQAMKAGLRPEAAWSLGSLHPATRFAMDGDFGSISPGRRADLVLLSDDHEVQSTWFGGELVVADRKVTPVLDAALSDPYRYPEAAYQTVNIGEKVGALVPEFPAGDGTFNAMHNVPPGIVLPKVRIAKDGAASWGELCSREGLCHVAVVERHTASGRVGHGLIKDFGLRDGAVASSVGHDAHNIVIAGTNEADMRVALGAVDAKQGGVCVVRDGEVVAMVDLPVAGLLSDRRAPAVAEETTRLKIAWREAGCRLAYMGFNLIPLSVIPDVRVTDMGIVLVVEMEIVPLFEEG